MTSQVAAARECARVAEEVTYSVQVRGDEKWNWGAKTKTKTGRYYSSGVTETDLSNQIQGKVR